MLVVPKTVQIHIVVGPVPLEVLVLASKTGLAVGMFACRGLVKHAFDVDSAAAGIVVDECCDEVYVCWSLCHLILLLLVRRTRPM